MPIGVGLGSSGPAPLELALLRPERQDDRRASAQVGQRIATPLAGRTGPLQLRLFGNLFAAKGHELVTKIDQALIVQGAAGQPGSRKAVLIAVLGDHALGFLQVRLQRFELLLQQPGGIARGLAIVLLFPRDVRDRDGVGNVRRLGRLVGLDAQLQHFGAWWLGEFERILEPIDGSLPGQQGLVGDRLVHVVPVGRQADTDKPLLGQQCLQVGEGKVERPEPARA